MEKLLNLFVNLCNKIGILKINLACDWVWYQEEEPNEFQKYKTH